MNKEKMNLSDKVEDAIKEQFCAIKEECKTVGELKGKLKIAATSRKFEEPVMGELVRKVFDQEYEELISNIPLMEKTKQIDIDAFIKRAEICIGKRGMVHMSGAPVIEDVKNQGVREKLNHVMDSTISVIDRIAKNKHVELKEVENIPDLVHHVVGIAGYIVVKKNDGIIGKERAIKEKLIRLMDSIISIIDQIAGDDNAKPEEVAVLPDLINCVKRIISNSIMEEK